jgi:hypothetical protein
MPVIARALVHCVLLLALASLLSQPPPLADVTVTGKY